MNDDPSTLQEEPYEIRALDPRTFEQLVQNQSLEIQVRAREIDIQQQQDRHNFEYSKIALDAQLEDRKHERECRLKNRRSTNRLVILLAICVLLAIGISLWFGKDQVALEIIKSIVLLVSGGGAGYAIGRSKKDTPAQEPPDAAP